jgi:hypothetical protein
MVFEATFQQRKKVTQFGNFRTKTIKNEEALTIASCLDLQKHRNMSMKKRMVVLNQNK